MIFASVVVSLPSTTVVFAGFLLLLAVLQVQPAQAYTYSAGEYIPLIYIGQGTLISPNHPGHYNDQTNSIWLLEAPSRHAIHMKISPVAAEGSEVGYVNVTNCNDYLEVRDGNSDGNLHFFGCHTNETVTVVSTNRWLWVKFYSDGNVTNTGFNATFHARNSSTPDAVSPIKTCQSMRWQCPNKECISWSYRCDGHNDCGCVSPFCDEYGCGGINWTMQSKIACGISIGTMIFLLVFVGVGVVDWCLKRRQEEENARLEELEKSRGRRRPKAPVISMTVPSPTVVPMEPTQTMPTVSEQVEEKQLPV